jgi:type IV pilus assembly protein PilN
MRLNINLASQPYEAARFYRRRMGALVLALAVFTALLAGYIVYQRAHSRDINRQLAQVRWEIRGLDLEDAQARALLNKPANRDIADQSEFLNQLFARKALSWTRVFTEMERIVPPNLHVVSMKPEYTKSNDLELRVVVATDSRDRAIELVRRMEKSNHFRQAQVMAEAVTTNSSDQAAGPGNIQFDIAAIYVPSAQDIESAVDEGKPSEKSGNPQAQPKVPVTTSPAQSKPPVAASPAGNPSQTRGANPAQAHNGPPPKSVPARPH